MYGKISKYAFGLIRPDISAAKEIFKEIKTIPYSDLQNKCDGSYMSNSGLACRHQGMQLMLQGDGNDDGVLSPSKLNPHYYL